MKRAISGVIGVLLLVAAMAAPAAAQTYGGGAGPTVTLSLTIASPGQTIVVTISDFPAGTLLGATFQSTPVSIGSVTTDTAGSAVLTAQVPTDAALGAHEVVVSGGGVSASAALTVVAPGTGNTPTATPRPTRSGGLAFTGANVTSLLLVAFALLGFGAAAVARGRRRRSAT